VACYTCGEPNHFSRYCDTYKTQICHYVKRVCRYSSSQCRDAHTKSELRDYCSKCECSHIIGQHVYIPEAKTLDPCSYCNKKDHVSNTCPDRWCTTCRSSAHWTAKCLKCGHCRDYHNTWACPYVKHPAPTTAVSGGSDVISGSTIKASNASATSFQWKPF
jgi:hypothetical protein